MKGKAVIVGLLVGAAVLLLLYYFYTLNAGDKYQWSMTLRPESDQPYGTLYVKKMLESYRSDGTFTFSQKLPIHKLIEKQDFSKGDTDYVLIGHSMYLDDADLTALMSFLRAGNDVFIATSEPPTRLIDSVYSTICAAELRYEYDVDSILNANFYHQGFRRETDYEFRYRVGASDFPFFWRSIDRTAVCSTSIGFTPLGYQQQDRVNFLRIDVEGKGSVYLHTSPLLFTNYYMRQPDKLEYASAVFSHLSGRNIIWDEVSKVPISDMKNPYESPLYYIMQQPALKYAWWMLLAGAILYVIFASKRTQQVIPVLEAKTNTSLEFLNVISSLHYQNPNHLDMARKKMKYFLYFIRARYGINAQTLTEEHAKRLSERSKVEMADIQVIHDRYKVIESYSISNNEPERLVGLYQAIDKFYKTCK